MSESQQTEHTPLGETPSPDAEPTSSTEQAISSPPAEVEIPEPAPEAESVEPGAETTEAPADEVKPEAVEETEEPEEEPLVTPGMDWFVLRVASNKEDYVRETLLRKVKIEGLADRVNRILVPTEKIKTIKAGKQRITERKLYPGYVFVEMKLEADGRIPQDVFFLIKETTGVGDFIGTAGRPAPMQRHEVEKMVEASRKPDEQPEIKMEFKPGDPVKIKEG
ncbi:MAG: hypothetical protein OER86_03175, partial [Phycisphaerae bacterium]|nr:hypothetical protein [Phycisphaerae bacterium]